MKKPNLLFIMTDQQKATTLDLYNDEVNFIETKGLKMVANEGVIFENAYCPSPLCVPSRIAMITGMYPSYSGFVGNEPYIEDRYETIFGAAKENGYNTMLVGKDHAYYKGDIGRDKGKHPEFMDKIFDKMYFALHNLFQPPEIERDLPKISKWLNGTKILHKIWGSEVAPWNSDESITARLYEVAKVFIKEWFENERKRDIPFAMWLSIPDPHELYQAPRDIVEMIDPASIELPPNWESDIGNRSEYIQFMHWYFNSGGVPHSKVKKLIRIYLAMCKNVDIYLEKLFNFLKEIGIWEDTIILFTSDHGDFNGEHQLIQKFNCGYDGCCRVPLIMAWPGRTKPKRVYEYPVNLVDIPSTLCDILNWKRFSEDQGKSMENILFSDNYKKWQYTVIESGISSENLTTKDIKNFPGHRYDILPLGRWSYDPPHRFGGKMYAVRSKDYKLIVRQEQQTEFYDMKNDPWESKNIYNENTYKDEIFRHYHFLVQHLARISYKQKGTAFAIQDDWYRAGGDKTWDEVVPKEFLKFIG